MPGQGWRRLWITIFVLAILAGAMCLFVLWWLQRPEVYHQDPKYLAAALKEMPVSTGWVPMSGGLRAQLRVSSLDVAATQDVRSAIVVENAGHASAALEDWGSPPFSGAVGIWWIDEGAAIVSRDRASAVGRRGIAYVKPGSSLLVGPVTMFAPSRRGDYSLRARLPWGNTFTGPLALRVTDTSWGPAENGLRLHIGPYVYGSARKASKDDIRVFCENVGGAPISIPYLYALPESRKAEGDAIIVTCHVARTLQQYELIPPGQTVNFVVRSMLAQSDRFPVRIQLVLDLSGAREAQTQARNTEPWTGLAKSNVMEIE